MMRKLLCVAIMLVASRCFAAESQKPNIIFILCDDLGYGDVGCFYQNSRPDTKPKYSTPHIDELAASGTMLMNHYTSAPVCAPARASLLTGKDQGHCEVRDNQFDKALGPELTLASMLKQAGYETVIIGKYGLAGPEAEHWPAHPLKRGFDEFFGFLEHRSGHVYYHDEKHPLRENYENVTEKYKDIYSTDLFTARAKKYLDEHAHDGKPIFMYLAYTAIHMALQVPGEPYPKDGLHWPLKPTPKTKDTYIYPEYRNKPWNDAMKRHASMARRLDDGVNDVMNELKKLGIDKNTLIVFSSDNGPANEAGGDPRFFDSWGPFDGFKRDCWEGGVREPTIVVWPGHVQPGTQNKIVSGLWDWMPTFADVVGLPKPEQANGISLVPALTGSGEQPKRDFIYMEYYFKGNGYPAGKDVYARKRVTGREQQQMVRMGDFVGIRVQIKSANDPIRLYNVEQDPHQDHDLASQPQYADMVKRIKEIMVTARVKNDSAPRPYDNATVGG